MIRPPAVPRRTDPRPAGRGFTLVEMLVIVLIAGIVASMGAPSMLRLLARHATDAAAGELRDALRGARSEAMKRGGPVVVCRTTPQRPGRCADGGGDWRTWMAFADTDRSGVYEAGEPVLASHAELSPRVAASAPLAALRFDATGVARADDGAAAAAIVFAPAAGGTDRGGQRQVCVRARGDIALVEGAGGCP